MSIELNRNKYTEKVKVFEDARHGATALGRVRKEHLGLSSWSPATLEGTQGEREKSVKLDRDILGVQSYFEASMIGALEHVIADDFTATYYIYGDLVREAVFGENTNSATITISWEQMEVDVELYPGVTDPVGMDEQLIGIKRNGLKYRDALAKCTAWNRDEVKNLTDDLISGLQKMIDAASLGQNKYTRLVKGFLLYLECLEKGAIATHIKIVNALLYGPNALLSRFRVEDTSYVFNSDPQSNVHSAVLQVMCEAYPPDFIQSHVRVPADGGEVYMVSQGALPNVQFRVSLQASQVLASIVKYSRDVGVMSYLQSALVTACSLQQNRYFSKVGLPKVVAYSDLLQPAMIHQNVSAPRPIVSHEMGKGVGRIHQMLAFMTVRDVITAGQMTTKQGFDGAQSIRLYLSQQEDLIARMGSYFTDIAILEANPQMKYISRLTERDFQDLANISALEALWLCDRTKKIVDNGVVMMLKSGVKDMSDDTSSQDVLRNELRLAGVTVEDKKIPTGVFTVEAAAMAPLGQSLINRRNRRRIKEPVQYVQQCEFKPQPKIYEEKRRFRKNGKKPVITKPVAKTVLFSPPPRRPSSSISPGMSAPASSPPSYEEEKSSTISSKRSDEMPKMLPHMLAQEATGRLSDVTAEDVAVVTKRDHVGDLIRKLDLEEDDRNILESLGAQDSWSIQHLGAAFHEKYAKDIGTWPKSENLQKIIVQLIGIGAGLTQSEGNLLVDVVLKTRSGKALWARKEVRSYIDWVVDANKLQNITLTIPKVSSPMMKRLVEAAEIIQPVIPETVRTTLEGARVGESIRRSLGFEQKGSIEGGTELSNMMAKRSIWTGDVETAPRAGLKFIAHSTAWLEFCSENGIVVGQKGGSRQRELSLTLANYYSRNPNITLDSMPRLARWYEGTSIDIMPMDLDSVEWRRLGEPEEWEYLVRDTSMQKREFTREDANWLQMAATLENVRLDHAMLKRLKETFRVPYHVRQELKRKYGFFTTN
ncbi:capsid protein [Macrophomina phaseolina chrysovirus 1]|uniref:Capsid protein n=1 Tax=Macrophomina phaseolina chrysovirus 1 TaxID=1708483 RepID=A0A0M4LD02_9VIRU|nr:capsid protein [Macrophomina phaseolina chrysovirus 1]ALD89091.2 capsid protein [Macrophomina phaseolina chrysovirus 1]